MKEKIDQFKRIEEVFESAIRLPPSERQDYLRQACKGDSKLLEDVRSLLDEDARCEVDSPTQAIKNKIQQTVSAPPSPSMPDRVGNYRIIRECGHGGMGTVYEAVQDSPERRVALKMIRPGMMTRQLTQRFRYETEFLGRLQHAGVGQIFEAGVVNVGAGEQPYFVMEFIDGAPLLEHIRQAEFSTTNRLMLFVMICDAIQHAHQRGVIHRDLKPENILVVPTDTESRGSSSGHYASMVGQPKVLDFGIARATNADIQTTIQTEAGALVGTLQYMSPEQAAGNSQSLDVRSDIYALGVILFEMLCDRPPYDLKGRNIAECIQIIREQDPSRLSSVHSRFRGDLETIVGKCLEKDPERRYASASDLAGDVRRHLQDEPITARPPDTWYQLRKFSRRNRQLVIGVMATVLALTAGLIATTIYALRADEQRDRAVQAEARTKVRAEELEMVSQFQADMLGQIDPTKAGKELTADVTAKFTNALVRSNVPEAEWAGQIESFKRQWMRVNATDAARELIDSTILKPAIETIDKQFKNQPVVDALLRQTLAFRYKDLGLYDSALPLQTSALTTRRRVLGNDHPDTLASINNMGSLLRRQGKLDEAMLFYREALEGNRRVMGDDHPDTLISINNIGLLLEVMGKYAEAEPYFREAMEGNRRVLGNDHRETLNSIGNMGLLLQMMGKPDEAIPYTREALEGKRRVEGDDHPRTLTSINNMGAALRAMGKLDEAMPYYREALDGKRRVLGDDHPHTLQSIYSMGGLLRDLGQLDGAELLGAEAVTTARRVLPKGHWHAGVYLSGHARTLAAMKRFAEAEAEMLEAYDTLQKALGSDHKRTIGVIKHIVNLYDAWHDAEPGKGYNANAAEWKAKLDAVAP